MPGNSQILNVKPEPEQLLLECPSPNHFGFESLHVDRVVNCFLLSPLEQSSLRIRRHLGLKHAYFDIDLLVGKLSGLVAVQHGLEGAGIGRKYWLKERQEWIADVGGRLRRYLIGGKGSGLMIGCSAVHGLAVMGRALS